MNIKSMIFTLLSLISTQVLLIDDLNLGKTPDGSRSLANLSGNLQNQYGESVSVVTPTQRQAQVPAIPAKYNKINPQRPNLAQRIPQPMKMPGSPSKQRKLPSQNPGMLPRKTMKMGRMFPNFRPNKFPLAQNFPSAPRIGSFRPLSKPVRPPERPPQSNMISPSSYPSMFNPIYFPGLGPSDQVPGDVPNDLPTVRPRKSTSHIPSRTISDHASKRTHPSTSQPTRTTSTESVQLDPPAELSTPEIDKDIDESIFDNEPIRPSKEPEETTSKTPKRSIATKTVTKTVKEPVKVVEHVSVTVPEKKDSSSHEAPPDEIEKVAKEVSKIVVPRVKGTGYLRKHNSDIISADKHRRTYIDYKLLESKERQVDIERKLKALQELQDKLSEKLIKLKNERDSVKSKIDSSQISLENSERAVKNLQDEINKNAGQMKLEEIEIIKLEKALSEEKNRYLLLTDQQKIFQTRLDKFNRKGDVQQDDVNISRKKLAEYDKLVEQIEKDFSSLKERIEEVERKRNDEIEIQNRLEIEKKEIEDSSHLPLFALYD